jgi:hypothetical protein
VLVQSVLQTGGHTYFWFNAEQTHCAAQKMQSAAAWLPLGLRSLLSGLWPEPSAMKDNPRNDCGGAEQTARFDEDFATIQQVRVAIL